MHLRGIVRGRFVTSSDVYIEIKYKQVFSIN